MSEDQYFYCYNRIISDFLWKKGIKYITIAIEPKSKRMYSMYKQTEELSQALKEYKHNKI